MAVAKLSTVSSAKFRGGADLTSPRTCSGGGGMFDEMNLIINKVGSMIDAMNGTGSESWTKLYIGTVGGPYLGGNPSWLIVDGTNAPTLGAMRFLDTVLGTYKTVTVANSLVTVT